MEPEETLESPGKYLKARRESKRLSLKRVADATNIREGILNAIEEDKYGDLPPLYVKSFLRSYARYLVLDPDEVIRLHQKIMGNTIASKRKAPGRQLAPRKKRVNVRQIVIVISALLLAAILAYAFLRLLPRVFSSLWAEESSFSSIFSIGPEIG